MSWLVGLVWGVAVLVAIVVLGYSLFDVRWKSVRLTKDLAQLNAVRNDLVRLQAEIASASQRLAGGPNGG